MKHSRTSASVLVSPQQRQAQIAALLEAREHCSVEELVSRFAVSDMTVRRDLERLAQRGRVIRTHGGAAAAPRVSFEFEFLRRQQSADHAKQRIGAAAAALVKNGERVMLDSGTTTLAVAGHLKTHAQLTVITTSLPIASSLQFAAGVRVLLLGGYLRGDSPDLNGALTESNLEQLRANIAIVGADAIDERGTVYHGSPEMARLVSKMAAAADRVYVVADASKLGRTGFARSGSLKQWNGLVTDAAVTSKTSAALKRRGVRLIHARGERNGCQPIS